MAFDVFYTPPQAADWMQRCSMDALRQQITSYGAEWDHAIATGDWYAAHHAAGRLAVATEILKRRTAGPDLDPAAAEILARRRAAAIQRDDERRGD